MTEPVSTACVAVGRPGSLHRRALLAIGERVDIGVHGPIAAFYCARRERERSLPVDDVVAATGGGMLGTVNGAPEVRQVKPEGGALRAEGKNVNELREGLPARTEVRVRCRPRVPKAAHEAVGRALARHPEKGPTARPLARAVRVTWTAGIGES